MMVEGILASDTCSYNHKHSLTSTQTQNLTQKPIHLTRPDKKNSALP